MDNLQNGADPTAVDTTTSEGQSPQETQPVEAPETTGNGEGEESGVSEVQNPWDTDDRFKGKTQEDIWKSYQELQKTMGSKNEEAEALRVLQENTGMTPSQIKQFFETRQEQAREQERVENPVGYLSEEINSLKSKLAYQEEEKSLNTFISEKPEFAPFKEKMMKLAMGLERDKTYEEIADEYFGSAISQGAQDAYKKIEQKVNTRVTGAGQSTPKKTLTHEDMENMSIEELEAILPHSTE